MESEFERSRCDLFVFLRADNVAMMTVLCWYHLSFIVIIIIIIIIIGLSRLRGLFTSLSRLFLSSFYSVQAQKRRHSRDQPRENVGQAHDGCTHHRRYGKPSGRHLSICQTVRSKSGFEVCAIRRQGKIVFRRNPMGRLFYLGFTRDTLNKTSLHMEEDFEDLSLIHI